MGILDKLKELFKDKRTDVQTRFEILKEAISGTMSNFHVVREISTGKVLGLKLLDKEKTSLFEERFKVLKKPSEGQIASGMKHPRIVETYEYGTTSTGQSYIVMEYVKGQGLNAMINSGDKLLDGNRLTLIRHMAEAIEAVHKAGYIHRDICPRNFIVAQDGQSLKLIDFGLTLPAKPEYMLPGNRTGTPLYMAPEIVRRRATDQRVDLFSLGVTCYYLLTGEHPWPSGDTTGKGALQHDTLPARPILEVRPNLNPTLAKAIMQLINPDPAARPESAEAFLKQIRPVQKETA
jgi:serine/threonine-protein kinase